MFFLLIKKIVLALSLFLFFSCNNDGTIIHNQFAEESQLSNNLVGDGCSQSTTCYLLGDLYYDFSSDEAIFQSFYKFNRLTNASPTQHNPVDDILGNGGNDSIKYKRFS